MYRGLLIQTSIHLPAPMYLMRCTLLQKLQRLSQNQDVKSFQKILDPGTPFDSRMARTKHNGKSYIMQIITHLDIDLHPCPAQLFNARKHPEWQIYTLCDSIPVTWFQKLLGAASPKRERQTWTSQENRTRYAPLYRNPSFANIYQHARWSKDLSLSSWNKNLITM